MSLTDAPIPPRPDYFGPDGAPPGVELRLDAFGAWADGRPKITPRVLVAHTNGANRESSTEGQIRWSNGGATRTHAHYNLGDKCVKTLRTDRRGIGNATEDWYEDQENQVDASFWSIVVETADMGKLAALEQGYDWPANCGPFLHDNAEILARIIAYESIVWGYPIEYPDEWDGTGVVAHTYPFPHPAFTLAEGKTCPGSMKIYQLTADVLPRARQIAAAWTAIPEDDMSKVNAVFIRMKGTADHWVCFPVSGDTKARLDPDEPTPIVVDGDRAEFERRAGYPLTPMPGE